MANTSPLRCPAGSVASACYTGPLDKVFMNEKFWLNTDDFFFYENKDGHWARHHQATLGELKFFVRKLDLEIRELKAIPVDTTNNPKSSGLMALLRARLGLRKG